MMLGPYKVPNYEMRISGVVTNKVPIGAYRGFGQPQSTFVMEGLVDRLASRLGRDRAEIRRLNMIEPADFPYENAVGYQYDSGDYPNALDRALELIDYDDFPKRQAEARRQGRYLGLGITCFVQAGG